MIASNIIAVIVSLGEDGSDARTGSTVSGPAQQENTSGATLGGGPTGITYRVANDQVFVQTGYSQIAGSEYDDIVDWIAPNTLYLKMIEARQLP